MRRTINIYTKNQDWYTIKNLGDSVYSCSCGDQIVREGKKWYRVKYGTEPMYLGKTFREAILAYAKLFEGRIPEYQMQ